MSDDTRAAAERVREFLQTEADWTPFPNQKRAYQRRADAISALLAVHLTPAVDLEELCEVMHDAYELAAVGAGWETQQQSRKPWADVPEANKVTMRAAVSALLVRLNLAGVSGD